MRRILTLAAVLLWVGLSALSTEVGSIRGFLYGSEPACAYDNWVSHVAEGKVSWLNVYAPWDEQNNDFGDYHIPSTEELNQWAQVVQAWLALDLAGAQAVIDSCGFPYDVVQFQDTDSGRLFYMLREQINAQLDTNDSEDPELYEYGSFDYGWGLYIYDPSASRPMMITAPHPCDDYPSPVISIEALLAWDARFLLVAGAGREVAYFPPYHSNNQSISDPSRFADHPFNVTYQHAATQLRGLTGRTEFSVQLHTYDWNKYPNKAPVMLSAGNGRLHPTLPVRDHRRAPNDLIHNTPWQVMEANSFGTHDAVDVSQYYSIYRASAYEIYYEQDGISAFIPQNTDLPGASENCQMLFTQQFNLYDSYSPFLHIEMDELPRCFDQSGDQRDLFYGYSEEMGWPLATRYTRFLGFYWPVIEALDLCLDELLMMNDGNAPSNPENFRISGVSASAYVLTWQRSYDYDFDTYEIQTRWHDGVSWQLSESDRNLYEDLAWQPLNEYMLSFPENSTMIYVRMRARDKHGNVSAWTEELKVFRPASGMGSFAQFALQPDNGRIKVSFQANITAAVGYNVNRGTGSGPISAYATAEEHPELQHNQQGVYEFWDNAATNGQVYRYQLSAVYADGSEYWSPQILSAHAFKPITLYFRDLGNGQADSLKIAVNAFATDAQDALDIEKPGPGFSTVWIASTLANPAATLARDVKAPYYPHSASKLWTVKVFNSLAGQQLRLENDFNVTPQEGDLLIKDNYSGLWHDFRTGPLTWTATSSGYRTFELWWGYKAPWIEFPALGLQRFEAGTPVTLNWQVVNPARVTSVELWMVGPEDSILVCPGLSPTQTAFVWSGSGLPMIGSRLVVKGLATDGSELRGESPYLYDLLPHNMVYNGAAGYSLISVPIAGWSAGVDELFSAGTTVWELDSVANWQNVDTLTGNHSYLVWGPQAWQLSLPMTENLGLAYQNLNHGWNLVANPHYHRYALGQLSFDLAGASYSWDELVAQEIISPRLYAFSETGWALTDHIEPLSAVLMWYQGSQPLSLFFNPQVSGTAVNSWPLLWSLSLSAWDGFRGRDGVEIGVADDASETWDPQFDLSKALLMPAQELSLALGTVATGPLQSEIKGLYPNNDQVTKTWAFNLEVANSGPVAFSYCSSDLPASYEVELYLDGQIRLLTPGTYSWIDVSAGTHVGQIRVRNYQSASLYAARLPELKVWPNPFRGSVALSVTSGKADFMKAEVYNLRGQKVRGLKAIPDGDKLTFSWDGKDSSGHSTASGIYFIRVGHGAQAKTVRVLKLD